MGLPADEDQPPFEYGSDCYLLTPDLWLPGECPKYITSIFSAIDLCPDWIGRLATPIPNGIPIICEQEFGDACRWTGSYIQWGVHFDGNSFGEGESGLILEDLAWGVPACWGHGPTQSTTSWANLLDCVGGFIGINGSGRIY